MSEQNRIDALIERHRELVKKAEEQDRRYQREKARQAVQSEGIRFAGMYASHVSVCKVNMSLNPNLSDDFVEREAKKLDASVRERDF